jgi:RNA polymerase sigma-70 factor, ECF subfamily
MAEQQEHRKFLGYFLPVQDVIRGYLMACTMNAVATDDLYQDVSATLWEKFGEFDESRDFKRWAIGVARLQVLKWKQKLARQRIFFCDETIERLAETIHEIAPEMDARYEALKGCIDELAPKSRKALTMHYDRRLEYRQIADSLSTTVAAIEMMMVRVRRSLRKCVETRLSDRETVSS